MPVVPGKLRMLYVAIRSESTWALDEIAQNVIVLNEINPPTLCINGITNLE